jgi:hypothetical protein
MQSIERVQEEISGRDRRTVQAIALGKQFFLFLSTITSVYFMYTAFNIGTYAWYSQVFLLSFVVAFQVALDFILVGSLFATGLRNTIIMFVQPTKLRGLVKITSVLMLVIGSACAFLSGYTSLKGSTIAGTELAGKFDADAAGLKSINSQSEQKEATLAPYRARLATLEAEKNEKINAAAGANLVALKAKGNQWAAKELARIAAPIEAEYKARILAAEKALERQDATTAKTYDKLTTGLVGAFEVQTLGHITKVEALQAITKYVGAASILLAILFEVIMTLLLVAATTKQKKASQPNALSASLSGAVEPLPLRPRGGGESPKHQTAWEINHAQ